MAETYKHLHQGVVSSAPSPGDGGAVTYAATDVTTIIRHMRVVNIHSAAVELTLWHMPPTGDTANANLIFPATDIAAGGSAEFDGVLIMDTGDRLFAKAENANVLYLNIYGLELT